MRHHQFVRMVVGVASGFAGLLVGSAGVAHATDFAVRPGKDTNVVFTSNAMVETFDGKTHAMTGTLTLEPGTVGDSITVHLEVDLASLDTGKALRNKHMREDHLETAKFPRAIFDGATVLSPAGAKLEPGKSVAFQIEGTFVLHGVTRRLRCDATATYTPQGKGGVIAFSATFPVTLGDYSIKRPEFLFLKLAETQQVRVSAVASSTP
jgi:polyisoprenoid-binding protein YceI